MDAASDLILSFFSVEVTENIFSNIWGGVETDCERQEVPLSRSSESEQFVMRNYGSF